ncbi:MAG: hypothetical protein ACHQ4J_12265 [Candidatus Binatia bacterium]
MRTVKWNAFLSGLCGFAAVLGVVTASAARADVTLGTGSSILIFPKVLANGTFDTVIEIANTGNSLVFAHCFYVNAPLQNVITNLPCTVPSSACVAACNETDFDIVLTKQQPTHWVVSQGRDVFTQGVESDHYVGNALNDAGFAPGLVPPEGCDVSSDPNCSSPFQGELKCIEVSETDEPLAGNHLKGEATLVAVQTASGNDINHPGATVGDISAYSAVGIASLPDASPSSNVLLLDGNTYEACPARLIVDHVASGADDPVLDGVTSFNTNYSGFTSSVSTELTLVPCNEDLEDQIFTTQTLDIAVYNEFETRFSTSTSVSCYLSLELTNIDSATNPQRSIFASNALLQTLTAHTEITPAVNSAQHAVIGVIDRAVTVTSGGTSVTARAAYDLHTQGDQIPAAGPDEIILPQLQQ